MIWVLYLADQPCQPLFNSLISTAGWPAHSSIINDSLAKCGQNPCGCSNQAILIFIKSYAHDQGLSISSSFSWWVLVTEGRHGYPSRRYLLKMATFSAGVNLRRLDLDRVAPPVALSRLAQGKFQFRLGQHTSPNGQLRSPCTYITEIV